MPYFLEILAVSRPFQIGTDDQKRPLFSCNFNTLSTPFALSPTLEETIGSLIIAAGLGTLNSTLFYGRSANIPTPTTTPAAITTVIDTGGSYQSETHNSTEYDRSSFQIAVRAVKYVDARDRATQIYQALTGRRNFTTP